jgi:hypothetical protein
MAASLAEATGRVGYITELSLDLGGLTGSAKTPYLSAGCPAPRGLEGAPFQFAKATFDFGKTTIDSTLVRTCKVRR